MDLITKISSLVACVQDSEDILDWWEAQAETPSIPRYWKEKSSVVVLKSFGSNGNIFNLKSYTHILGTKQELTIKGWIATPTSMVLVVDPKSLPSDLKNPYLIVAMSSDMMEYELVIKQIKRAKVNPCQLKVLTTVGYRDKYRKIVRFDIPEELEQ
jgi:hypothetical protein